MKKYSYNLFPIQLVLFGYILLILAIAELIITLNSIKSESLHKDFSSSIALAIISLIMILFKSKITIDSNSGYVYKESSLFILTFSREKIKIPWHCDCIIIKQKIKSGTGYYRAIIPVRYKFKSCDIFFHSETGIVRLINTDLKRAIKIAELLKDVLKIEYVID